MSSKLIELFKDTELVNRIKNKLPYLSACGKGYSKGKQYARQRQLSALLSELPYSSATSVTTNLFHDLNQRTFLHQIEQLHHIAILHPYTPM